MKISEMVARTRDVTSLFDKLVGPWDPTVMMTEMAGEVGTLADSIMIREGHRPPRDGVDVDLEDDIVDVLFMLVRIADHYGIDLERTYQIMILEVQQKLEHRLKEQNSQN
ncbi:hypothetical protein KSF_107950 [Reticulibacter mediterranei]|uniref:NTP pyrophosphohydrolase MazG putative catalytic core domain-containing protein n=1 Tax=Reticulibacter mediterranei TaxID=2778369 RepID=A0A8J3N6U6_9CHLR|nr:hypothetical protein [Reticulibacter mediterranei]GHP00748.1 hypothetical protein KSF_107950 [Reticulibacter mediterranei]